MNQIFDRTRVDFGPHGLSVIRWQPTILSDDPLSVNYYLETG